MPPRPFLTPLASFLCSSPPSSPFHPIPHHFTRFFSPLHPSLPLRPSSVHPLLLHFTSFVSPSPFLIPLTPFTAFTPSVEFGNREESARRFHLDVTSPGAVACVTRMAFRGPEFTQISMTFFSVLISRTLLW